MGKRYRIDELTGQVAGIIRAKDMDVMDYVEPSHNLVNKQDKDYLQGYYLLNGIPYTNPVYNTTPFLQCSNGELYYFGNSGALVGIRFIAFFDQNKNHITTISSTDGNLFSIIIGDGYYYFRVVFSASYKNFHVNKDNLYIYDDYSTGRYILDQSANVIPNLDKYIHLRIGDNLLDKLNSNFLSGCYISNDNRLFTNGTYNTSGGIQCMEGESYFFANNGTSVSARFVIAYGSSPVSGDYIIEYKSDISSYTIPNNVKFIRVTYKSSYSLFQINKTSIKTYDQPSGIQGQSVDSSADTSTIKLRLDSLSGQSTSKIKQGLLPDGAIITNNDFPYHGKKGLSMSLRCNLTSLIGSVKLGKGYSQYRGDWFEIDSVNITWKHYETSETSILSKPHGLLISTFLNVTIYVDDSSLCYVIIQSIGGYFSATFQWNYEMNYSAFVSTSGQDLNNVQLSCGNKDFHKSVWIFGDSYVGLGLNRWAGVIRQFGFFNLLLNGLAGQGSSGAFNDLIKSLNFGTPKFLIWALGMNDDYTSYSNTLTSLLDLCKSKDIALILTTVPTVPTRDKEAISQMVRESGYRYIDFYSAVGTNSVGGWYPGYLSTDGVHPTEIGAQALAMQVLQDFPELMQYGLVSTNSEIGNITGDN